MSQARTTSQKIWDNHVVRSEAGKPDLLYIDLHLVHEVTSPQAFEGLRLAGRKVRRPDLTLATVDHNVPTIDRDKPWTDPLSVQQVEVLRKNCEEFAVVPQIEPIMPRSPARREDQGGIPSQIVHQGSLAQFRAETQSMCCRSRWLTQDIDTRR